MMVLRAPGLVLRKGIVGAHGHAHDTRVVAQALLEVRGAEGLFHPRVYGTEPTAVASISIRIDITHRRSFPASVEDGIVKPMMTDRPRVRLTTPQRS